MNKLVVLNLSNGDLNNGFPVVTAHLWEPGNPHPMKFTGALPAAPEIPKLYSTWQFLYKALHQRLDWCPRLEIEAADITNVSEFEFSDLCQQLDKSINAWFNSEPFRHIDQQLRTFLDPSQEIRLIIETNDPLLQRIPWNLWKFLEHYPKAEVALSTPEYTRRHKPSQKKTESPVRILAILGNSQGIDIGKDRAFLEQLSGKAHTKFLVEPLPALLNDQLWEEGWDILFFAGHSSSEQTGRLQLNQSDSLTLSQLRYALKKAIERGLRLAIFNSCDGLGLAQELADLHIPQVIVMREPVPDQVAQEFLRHFLKAFSGGQSLYASVRESRERLQPLEGEYPCATWLPVICQNPAEVPTTWQELSAKPLNPLINLSSRSRLKRVLFLSVMVTAAIMGVRHLGMLQTWELQAFDQLMQLRSDETHDPRLLIVTVDDDDIDYQYQNKMGEIRGSLSDQALAQLLNKLEPYQPRTIGIDIYRASPVDSNAPDLATRLRQDHRIFALCKVPAPEDDAPDGVHPPPEVPKERLSFSDFVADDDEVARRHLLQMTLPLTSSTSSCVAQYAFSLQLALHYLDAKGIKLVRTPEGYLRIGNVVFKRLTAHTSGYQGVDASGYQVLLNYRSLRNPKNIARQVPLKEILSDGINPKFLELVKDRIVLIGVIAPSTADYWKTPYSAGALPNQKQIPGVFVQAQMVSHILSAVLDRRPLFWWWPLWVEVVWVWGWSLMGGILAWRFQQPLHLGLVGVTALGALFGICFGIFTQAGWVPLIPSGLALVVTPAIALWWFAQRPHSVNNKKY